ncbi:transcription factor 25 isoform X1 [Monodon monoceros]|uniref:transcription factor 25 isoform X1 n=1 Tax=Monodon monoceros TaxID=40151 RepID=UPI0010F69899|nr:transcription factor 25 isoform X1 [Monodon monoceros]
MSRRALRRLRGEQRGQEPLGPGALQFVLHDDDDVEEEGPKRGPGGRRPRGPGKEGVRVNNRFELINIEDLEEAPGVNGDRTDCLLIDAAASGNKRRAQRGHSESKKDGDVTDAAVPPEQSNTSGKLRKKKRKQKNKKNAAGESSENGLEDIDRILERIEDASGSSRPGPPPLSAKKHVLYVEHRHLNPDTELKRYFGARAVLGEQRPRQRQRVYPKCTWLTTPKSAWPRYTKPESAQEAERGRRGLAVPVALRPGSGPCALSHARLHHGSKQTVSGADPMGWGRRAVRVPSLLSWDVAAPSTVLGGGMSSQERCRGACRWCGPSCGQSALGILTQAPPTTPGLSMRLLESRKGRSAFAFEHSEEYQQTQHRFLAAVESMEPNNMVVLLQTSPYHVDSLLQLSDACRFQEDQEMARDLVERALYSMECAFHPLFSLTSGTCRLDYRRPENRSFYLALYKQMSFLEKRGCPRTALEYCKLILSLEPDEDPLCMLLLLDHLALRARSYEYLIRLFQEWEAHRNLSQLPNFAFSVPLAYFLLSQQADLPDQELSSAKEKASLLIQQALIMFPGVLMPLLEYCSVRPDATVAAHRFFGPDAEISQPPALSQLVSLYLGRSHFLWKEPATMSWLEENVHEVLQAVDAGDPAVEACENRRKVLYQRAPRNIHRHVVLSEIKEAIAALPPDVSTQSVLGYDPLPPLDTIYSYVRPERLSPVSHGNTIALFFRSLLPNYTVEGERPEDGGAGGPHLDQGLNRLMLALRDMMANFHFHDLEVPHEDHLEGDEWD